MCTFSNTGAEGQGVRAGSAKGNKGRGREKGNKENCEGRKVRTKEREGRMKEEREE